MAAWRKAVTVGGVLLAIALGGGLWWRSGSIPEPPQFVTQKVTRGDVVSRVTATGTLSATVTVQVGTQVSGRIQTLGADFNSQVKKGDVLATIDPQLFSAALAQATANEKAAQANLTKARAQSADAQRKLVRAAAGVARRGVR